MRRRSGTSDETVKAQRHRAATLKRRNEPKAVREHSPSIAALQDELDRRTRERDEALEQQTATSEILASISGSMTDPKPVFDAIVRNLLRLLGTRFASVSLLHDGIIEMPAADGMPGIQSLTQLYPRPLDDTTVGGQAMLSRQVVQYAPIIGNAAVPATAQKIARDFSYNSIISAPMIRQDKVFGAISAAHHESRAFDGKEIALIKAFADQAVIAIENARLLNELRQRTDDLSVSLQQQTATADVLKVISRSTFDLQVVLNTLVESAARLCDSDHAWLFRRDGEVYRWATGYGLSREGHEQIKQYQQASAHSPGRGSIVGRTALEGQPVQIVDVLADPEYVLLDLQKIGNYRTVLGIPLLRESLPTGVLVLTRSEPRPFTSKQIELLTTFADQAVIAIENVRLFEAEQQRTRELTESLEQQTATSEVLHVISSSPGDVQPVFETMLEKAVSICDAKYGNIYRWDGEFLHLLAAHDTPPALAEFRRRSALRPSLIRRMVETKTAIHVIDVAADPEYLERRTPSTVAAVELGGVRSFLSVPMLKENELIGSFSLYRQEVRPFTDKQIALVTSFARQAVIAIENARLLSELRESLQQQTATADVLKVISRSTFDLQTVLDTLTASAARLCDADFAFIFQRFGDLLHHAASHGFSSDFIEYQKQNPIPLGRGSLTGRTALEGKMVHIPDVLEDPEYTWTKSIELAQYRTMLGIPLSREGVPIGVIALSRRTVRPFTDRQIELMTTFADQAVIAIENARLLNELRESLEQQTATSKVLDVISRSAFDLRAVFEAVIESSVRLCGADRGHFYRFDGELLRVAAAFNASRELMEFVERTPIPPGRNSASGRAMVECRTVHIPDCLADPEYSWGGKDVDPVRTILAVPTLKGNDLLGMIVIYRLEVSPFTDTQPRWSRLSPTRQQSPSRTSDFWTHCASAPMSLAARSASCERSVKCPKQ
jgi:GAF domain-containing protein